METRLRGLLGEGLASQQPRSISEQIRALVSRGVTFASSCYPQLCCVLAANSSLESVRNSIRAVRDRVWRRGWIAGSSPAMTQRGRRVTVNAPPTRGLHLSIQNHAADYRIMVRVR